MVGIALTAEPKDIPKGPDKGRRRASAKVQPLWETEARAGPKLEARAHLLEAAASAFMERGYAATTLDHVANKLGTTKGQIYHYYRAKSDLYFDVVVGAYFILNDQVLPVSDLPGLSPVERLRRASAAHASVIMTTWAWQRVALEATQHQLITRLTPRESRALARMAEFRDSYEQRFAAIIGEGMETGDFARAPLDYAAKAALGSLNWLTVWYDARRSHNAASRALLAGRIADFVVAGLSPAREDWRATARRELGLTG